MNIENFKGSFDNVARPNLFKVSGFGLPPEVEFRVKAATVPTSTVGTINVPYQSRTIKLAGSRVYDTWTITVMGTSDYNLYQAFVEWNQQLNSTVDNIGEQAGSYKRDGIVDHLDVDGSIIKTTRIIGAWPSIIGEVQLDWEQQDQIATFDVILEYDYHE